MSSVPGFQPMRGMQADPSLGDGILGMEMPPRFTPMTTTAHGDIGFGIRYSPTVQQALNADSTEPHVHWSNPLVTGQDAQLMRGP